MWWYILYNTKFWWFISTRQNTLSQLLVKYTEWYKHSPIYIIHQIRALSKIAKILYLTVLILIGVHQSIEE